MRERDVRSGWVSTLTVSGEVVGAGRLRYVERRVQAALLCSLWFADYRPKSSRGRSTGRSTGRHEPCEQQVHLIIA